MKQAALVGVLIGTGFLGRGPAFAEPRPPTEVRAVDHAWDNGSRIDVSWTPSPDESELQGYVVRRKLESAAAFSRVDTVPSSTHTLTVGNLQPLTPYIFSVAAVGRDNSESSATVTSGAVSPTMEWFDGTRVWFLVTLVLFSGTVVALIAMARRGIPLKMRRIAGLDVVDEAVGRATEMGRPCIFVPGVQDMNEIQTIAGLNVLGRVARTAAQYDADVSVPTSKSLVMTAARETLQGAYLAAGRPDAYNAEAAYYVTDEQFGYVAHLQGMMMRDKPAACFYMGSFFAESLILAETGNSVGAIQIAGTAQPAQLPFFVAACDYTLIGEEFFAASAYLSGEPDQLGSIKGQDVGKLIVAVGIVIGVLGATVAALTGSPAVKSFVDFLTETMLT
jgi:Domain of unknown function (DUF6754)/Fibronectin type III domain